MFNFLWLGSVDFSKYHLAAWEKIALSKNNEGWGIKKLSWFNLALCAKSMLRTLFVTGL